MAVDYNLDLDKENLDKEKMLNRKDLYRIAACNWSSSDSFYINTFFTILKHLQYLVITLSLTFICLPQKKRSFMRLDANLVCSPFYPQYLPSYMYKRKQ